MSDEVETGTEELRKLRPSSFLQGEGCLDAAGNPRADLAGNFATAACLAFEDGEAAPQELATVYEAIKQCLELASDGDDLSTEEFSAVVDEAFELTSGMLGKEINPAIAAWVGEWTPYVDSPAGAKAFLSHMDSVVQQYTLIIGLKA